MSNCVTDKENIPKIQHFERQASYQCNFEADNPAEQFLKKEVFFGVLGLFRQYTALYLHEVVLLRLSCLLGIFPFILQVTKNLSPHTHKDTNQPLNCKLATL